MSAMKFVSLLTVFFLFSIGLGSSAQQTSATNPAAQKVEIGEIDFFGYGGIDLSKLRAAFPARVGQELTTADFSSLRQKITDSVQSVAGKPVTDASFVCCDESGHWMMYIGLSGTTSKPLVLNDLPKDTAALPQSALDLNHQMMDVVFEAIQKHAGEDDSKGYFLSDYPPLREKQLAVRDFTVHHTRLDYGSAGEVLLGGAAPGCR